MLYIKSPSSLRKNGTSDARRDYIMNTDCQDTRQPFINRRKERDSRKNIMLML
jgi:hypothetical protein